MDNANKRITDEVWDFPNYVCETIERLTKSIVMRLTAESCRNSKTSTHL